MKNEKEEFVFNKKQKMELVNFSEERANHIIIVTVTEYLNY